MDVTYDYEVWNQPVVSYGYKYFNPLNRRERGSPPLENSISVFGYDDLEKLEKQVEQTRTNVQRDLAYNQSSNEEPSELSNFYN